MGQSPHVQGVGFRNPPAPVIHRFRRKKPINECNRMENECY
jgi:hypothetical protein